MSEEPKVTAGYDPKLFQRVFPAWPGETVVEAIRRKLLEVSGAKILALAEAWDAIRDEMYICASLSRDSELFYNAIADILGEPRYEEVRKKELESELLDSAAGKPQ